MFFIFVSKSDAESVKKLRLLSERECQICAFKALPGK